MTRPQNTTPDCAAIETWLVDELATLLAKPRSDIRTDRSVFEFGLDSSAAIGLTDLLAEFLDRDIDPKILYEYPTIEGLSKALAPAGDAK